MTKLNVLMSFGAGLAIGQLTSHVVSKYKKDQAGQATDNNSDVLKSRLLKYGVPQAAPEVAVFSNHALHYDYTKKIPLWVSEHITADHVKGKANRQHSRFRSDPSVPAIYQANNSDYWNSGWSRGHMAPAGNNKHDQVAMDDSFLLSNVLPQDLKNNADFWNRLEIYCRDLTKRYSDVHIISGPLLLPQEGEDGKKYIKYQVIGDNEVTVPTHLYKIVLVENSQREPQALGAFVVPNEPISRSQDLKQYQVDLDYVERKSGFQFLPNLARDKVGDLCKLDGCKMMGYEELELYIIRRRMEGANSKEKLDKIWKDIERKGLKVDDSITEVYNRKKATLSDS